MKWIQTLSVLAFAGALIAGVARAEDKPAEPQKFYRLDFVVKELEAGKVINSRSYSMDAAEGKWRNSIRTGNKIPYESQTGVWQQIDVGTSLDCQNLNALEDGSLSLILTAEVSSVLDNPPNSHPTLRQNKWDSIVVLMLRKPTVVFSSDDVSSKRTMQLEVTATPIAQGH